MIPVDQRYVQNADLPVGDCLAACVASIFELPLGDVPHFMKIAARRETPWQKILIGWSHELGFVVNTISYRPRKRPYRKPVHWHPRYWIAAVRSSYSDDGVHAIVMKADQVAHDPNPRSRERHEQTGYRFLGEIWFEVHEPAILLAGLNR